MRSHWVRIRRSLIHPGEKGGPTRRTGGVGGENTSVTHTLCSELVEIRGRHLLRAIATKIVAQILPDKPKDVRFNGWLRYIGSGQRGQRGKQENGDERKKNLGSCS